MNIAEFSIKRPILIVSLVLLIMIIGYVSLKRLGVDLYPNVEIPVVTITTVYPGVGPEDIETLVTKPVEEKVGAVSGIKNLTSTSLEGYSIVTVEFNLDTNMIEAQQQVRDKVELAKKTLPDDIEEPIIQKVDNSASAIMYLSLSADLPSTDLYDLADQTVKPLLEQVNNVGTIDILGGTKREVEVELDRNKINYYEIPSIYVAQQLKVSGSDVPVGKHDKGSREVVYRAVSQYEHLEQIENTMISFSGDVGSAVLLKELGSVRNGVEDRTSYSYSYSDLSDIEKEKIGFMEKTFNKADIMKKRKKELKPSQFFAVYKQSGSNTVFVADAVTAKVTEINKALSQMKGSPKLTVVMDSSEWIKINVEDVKFTIVLGIILAVLVVYLFLGNVRSTIITGLALPNSLLGTFILMYVMGFTVNSLTLLALSLTVGLLIDDAIVVRENIFRKLEDGMSPVKAALVGSNEVMLAVIATTITIIAVFFPIGFMSGIIGRFFKEFGFTVVFAMIISLFDAITVAPMLSAYFAGRMHEKRNIVIQKFDKFQDWTVEVYGKTMNLCLKKPLVVIIIAVVFMIGSFGSLHFVKKTFMPAGEDIDFIISIELAPGTNLDKTNEVVLKIEKDLAAIAEVKRMTIFAGGRNAEAYKGTFIVSLYKSRFRIKDTESIKDDVKKVLDNYKYAKPQVRALSGGGGGMPFNLNLIGNDLDVLKDYSEKLMERVKKVDDLAYVTSSHQTGKPEYQIQLDRSKMQKLGVAPGTAGAELRNYVAGDVVGKLHDGGYEYDIRMRLKEDQRDIKGSYNDIRVPNVRGKMVPLSEISKGVDKEGPVKILRESRSRIIKISANLSEKGALGTGIEKVEKIIKSELPPPQGVKYAFVGQAEDMKEMVQNIVLACVLSLIFIYLVLASLYESFITPLTILVALPPAMSGAFIALAVTGKTLDIMSMIGLVMLLGLVTKNSILLVDFALKGVRSGMSRNEAIYAAGMSRLRPILMTTIAMLAGILPVALGIGEAAKTRTSLGVAQMGGLIVSTLVTLIVVPAMFNYIDRFRHFLEKRFTPEEPIEVVLDNMAREDRMQYVAEQASWIKAELDKEKEEAPVKKSRTKKSE